MIKTQETDQETITDRFLWVPMGESNLIAKSVLVLYTPLASLQNSLGQNIPSFNTSLLHKRCCSPPNKSSSVGRELALMSVLDPLFKQSSLRSCLCT